MDVVTIVTAETRLRVDIDEDCPVVRVRTSHALAMLRNPHLARNRAKRISLMGEAATLPPRLSLGKKACFALLVTVSFFIALECVLALLGVQSPVADADPYVGFESSLPLFTEADHGDRYKSQQRQGTRFGNRGHHAVDHDVVKSERLRASISRGKDL